MKKKSTGGKLKSTAQAGVGAGKNFVNQGWTAIPMWAKGLLLVAVGYGVYKLAKGALAKSRLTEAGRDTAQEADGWNQEYIRDAKNQPPTMSTTQMKAAANAIFTAMDGYGTDEAAVYNQFKKIKNNADYSGLNAAWGRRTISSGRFNPEPNLANATLLQALASELGDSEKAKCNKILASAGVKYRI